MRIILLMLTLFFGIQNAQASCSFSSLPSVGNCTIVSWTNEGGAGGGGVTSPGITPQCINYPLSFCSQVVRCPASGLDFCYQRTITNSGATSQTMHSPVTCPTGYKVGIDKAGLTDTCVKNAVPEKKTSQS